MIIQTNTWICEKCGKIETTTEEVGMYDDPVVMPPKGDEETSWYINDEDKLVCIDC